MGEYGREQRNQLSRAIASSETGGGRQLKGFVDNRSKIIQRATNLNYNNDLVSGNTIINSVNHTRESVNETDKGTMKNSSPWKTILAGSVANHSRAYSLLSQSIKTFLDGKTLSDGAGYLGAKADVLGIELNRHVELMQTLANKVGNVSPNDTNKAFNYYIYRICDYPSNLFYWPDRTGNNTMDEPQTNYDNSPPSGWAYKDGIDSSTSFQNEKDRLTTGRDNLTNNGL